MDYIFLFIVSSNIGWLQSTYYFFEEYWIHSCFDKLWWINLITQFFIFSLVIDLVKNWIFSLIKCKKKDLNPRFWLLYLKILPFIWFFAWIYYWLKKQNFWKKDLVTIFILNIIYSMLVYWYAILNSKIWLLNYWNFDVFSISLFIFVIIWDIVYTKIILKNKNSLK